MQQQQQQTPGDKLTAAEGFNVAMLIMKSHATAITVFLRTDFGSEGIGVAGLGAIFLIIAMGGCSGDVLMYYYLIAFIIATVLQRIRTFRNWWRGNHQHSYYDGYPWLALKLFPRVKKEGDAKGMEAFLCLAIGCLLLNCGVTSLGMFIAAGFISIMFVAGTKAELVKRRLRAMRDAQFEQEYLAEEFRQKYRE